MKKPRHLLLVLTSLVLACILVFAVACKGGCKSCKSCADAELESIELTLDDVKTEYYTGDIFTAGGLKITANFTKGKPDDTITNQTEGVEIDSTAFNQDKIGTYEIKVSYTLNEKTAEATYNVNVSDVAISVDPSGAQRLFVVNEDDFNATGLKVFRTITSPAGATTTQLAATDYTVGSSQFKKDKVGTYPILVTYQIEQKYLNASYEVQVIERRQGLQVSFKDGKAENETITLHGTTEEVAKADLSEFASWIEARKPDKYGVVGANAELIDLSAENVTVELYEGMYPVTSGLDSLESGAYTIKVTMRGKDNADKDFDYIGFVNVFVIDDLKSLTWNENAAGTRTQQTAGKEVMSKTWQFTATYESGKTETVYATDNSVSISGLTATTATESEGATATVSFTAINAKRVPTVKSAEVTYKIDPLTGIQNYELTYKVENKAWVSEWKDDFEGAASQVSVTPTVQESVKGDNYSEVKNSSGKYVIVKIGSAAKNVVISAQIETSDVSRLFYITTSTSAVADNKIAMVTPAAKNTVYELKAENVAAGTYYITSAGSNDTIKIHSFKVTYSVDYDAQNSPQEPIHFNAASATVESSALSSNVSWKNTAGADAGVTILKSCKVTANSKTPNVNGTNITVGTRIQTAGQVTTNGEKAVKIELDSAATITVYFCHSGTGSTRFLKMINSEGTSVYQSAAATDTNITSETITLTEGGIYYLGGGEGGINIYYMVISYTAA